MKNIYRSYKAFVASVPMMLFISIFSCLIYYTSIVRMNLETIANMDIISKEIVLKTKVYHEYLCLKTNNEELSSFIYEGIEVIVDIEANKIRFMDIEIDIN